MKPRIHLEISSALVLVIVISLALQASAQLVPTQLPDPDGKAGDATQPVKVYILAGQSNMEGKAQNKLLEYQATDKKTADLFAHLRKDGQWITREDVFIKYLGRHGGLTIGYGSPNRTGVELELGTNHDHGTLVIMMWMAFLLQQFYISFSNQLRWMLAIIFRIEILMATDFQKEE